MAPNTCVGQHAQVAATPPHLRRVLRGRQELLPHNRSLVAGRERLLPGALDMALVDKFVHKAPQSG